MGVYQLKQSKSYTSEHLTAEGDYKLSFLMETPSILRLQMQSRHTSSKSYALWVEYGQLLHPITGWYCKCQAGARVVGCCAHIATVLWYLGYHRHQDCGRATDAINSTAVDVVEDAATAAAGWSEAGSEVRLKSVNKIIFLKQVGGISSYLTLFQESSGSDLSDED